MQQLAEAVKAICAGVLAVLLVFLLWALPIAAIGGGL